MPATTAEKNSDSLTKFTINLSTFFFWYQLVRRILDETRASGFPPTPAILVAYNPLWIVAIILDSSETWRFDLMATLFLLAFYYKSPTETLEGWQYCRKVVFSAAPWLATALVAPAVIWGVDALTGSVYIARELFRGKDPEAEGTWPEGKPPLIPPLLIPARTTHTRFVPKKHSFSYSYFYVGIPVGWCGLAGSALSADMDLKPKAYQLQRGWFDVRGSDHLTRGTEYKGLEAKLRAYLHTEGVNDDEWSFAYLCTAPRFQGYSFNPVSFWYIYTDRAELTMMLLEVNNTFDERRLYLLRAGEGSDTNGDATVPGAEKKKFRDAWAKDFHVSPFNSRKGSYSLVAKDPLSPDDVLETAIDNVITLTSSKGEAKLVARVFSEGPAYEATQLTRIQTMRFVLQWFWVGFVTFPRIIYQAFGLFFKRKLHVWYRPEVLPSSISRQSTQLERFLEKAFRRYLQYLLDQSPGPISLRYTPSGDIGETCIMTSRHTADKPPMDPELEIKALSPAFYTRFVHYAHTTEAFRTEATCADEKVRTMYVSKPIVLEELLAASKVVSPLKRSTYIERKRWDILKTVRCPPPRVSAPEESKAEKPGFAVEDIRTQGFSHMDRFVQTQYSAKEAMYYRRNVTWMFMAEKYAFGFFGLFGFAECGLRVLMLLFSMWMVTAIVEGSSFVHKTPGAWAWEKVRIVSKALAAASIVHIWSMVKGWGTGR